MCSTAAGPGIGATTPDSADGSSTLGTSLSFFSACFSSSGGGVAGGVGGVSCFGFESREPTWSFGWYFLRMPSLWYFQNSVQLSVFDWSEWGRAQLTLRSIFAGYSGEDCGMMLASQNEIGGRLNAYSSCRRDARRRTRSSRIHRHRQ